MIPAESSLPDRHTQEDGQRTVQLGWRLSSALVCQVQECCRKEGLRPGKFMARALRCYLGHPLETERIYTAAELEARVKFPEHLFHGKWR